MAVGLARLVHLLLCHSIHFQPLLPAEDRLQKRDPVLHEIVMANTTLGSVLFKNGFTEDILIPCRVKGEKKHEQDAWNLVTH